MKSESLSVVSDSLRPHGLNSPWESPGQNAEVGSLSLLQGIFPTQGSNPGLLYCRWILYQLSHREAQEYQRGQPVPSLGDLPDPGIKPASPTLQVDSLPTELSGKPLMSQKKKTIPGGFSKLYGRSVQLSSVTQSCLTLCNPMDCSMPGFPVHHQLSELDQTHVHQVSDAIKPSHPLSSPSPPSFSLSQHQGLFQGVSSLHQVAKLLGFQLQHQSFQ